MLDAEIYVDRIADMRVNDMNAVLEAVRQMALMKNGGEENDLHLRTLEVAQIREDEYFGSLIADDLKGILRDIRSEHRPDTMTADEVSFAENMQNQLREARNFEGSSEKKKAKALLATLGIDYDAITMEQFVNLIEVLKLSKHLKTPISQRGKTTMTHGKGKRKKRVLYTFPSFSAQSDFASQKSCDCAVAHITKSACPTAAKKRLLPHSAAPQSMPPTSFPRQPEAKV